MRNAGAESKFYPSPTGQRGLSRKACPIITPRPTPHGGARTAADVADAAARSWTEIDRRLAPTIGKLGVAALFHRSVHLAQASHPWLAPVHAAGAEAAGQESLRVALAAHDADAAAAASEELLAIFHQLLAGLIGEALTVQLLTGAVAGTTRDPPP